jgi:hypothetical protein
VVHFAAIDGGNAFSAFLSWITGGRIERYVWSWVEQKGPISWFYPTIVVADAHRFVCPKPEALTTGRTHRICLLIEGTRITGDGFVESVSAGEYCHASGHEPVLATVPPWWLTVMIPFWASTCLRNSCWMR